MSQALPFDSWTPGELLEEVVLAKPIVFRADRAGTAGMLEYEAYRSKMAQAFAAYQRLDRLCFEMLIAVTDPRQLLVNHDLENYLTHLVGLLGAERFVLATARKYVGGRSIARMSRAESGGGLVAGEDEGSVRFSASSTSGFQTALRDNLLRRATQVLPPGPVAVTFALRTRAPRMWSNLWKQAGDAMEPVLGRTNRAGANPFDPQDDRIVNISFHRSPTDDRGHQFDLGIWWKIDEGGS